MMKKLVILLALFVLPAIAQQPPLPEPLTLKLISKDGKQFVVDRRAAMAISNVIRPAVEHNRLEVAMPIPAVMGDVLEPIACLIPIIASNQEKFAQSDLSEEEQSIMTQAAVMDDALFKKLPDAMMVALINAANYMDIQALLRASAARIAKALRPQVRVPQEMPLALKEIPLTPTEQKAGKIGFETIRDLPKELLQVISEQYFLGNGIDIDPLFGVKTYIPYERLKAFGFISDSLSKLFPNLETNPNERREIQDGRGTHTALSHTIWAHARYKSDSNFPLKTVRALLKLKGIDMYAGYKKAQGFPLYILDEPIKRFDTEFVKAMIQSGFDVTRDSEPLIIALYTEAPNDAAYAKKIAMVELLIRAHVPLNTPDFLDMLPIISVSRHGGRGQNAHYEEILRMLFDAGADAVMGLNRIALGSDDAAYISREFRRLLQNTTSASEAFALLPKETPLGQAAIDFFDHINHRYNWSQLSGDQQNRMREIWQAADKETKERLRKGTYKFLIEEWSMPVKKAAPDSSASSSASTSASASSSASTASTASTAAVPQK